MFCLIVHTTKNIILCCLLLSAVIHRVWRPAVHMHFLSSVDK